VAGVVTVTDMTTVVSPAGSVGELLRSWRQRRRRSQLDLALEAEVSARHLSFVETGRSRPSRELLLHLAQHLDVPLRERNSLLLAAGYAPHYPERTLDDETMTPVRQALDKVLAGHEPFPAVVVDRRWNMVSANSTALRMFAEGIAPELLAPPANAVRVALHPDGMAPRIVNLDEYSAHMLHRLRQQVMTTHDPGLADLYDEVCSYPGVEEAHVTMLQPEALVFTTLRLRPPPGSDGPNLAFFSTLATFGTALDVTAAELAIESFFPADETTTQALHH
jgi:transcriptional regulator with XRE-family HTH domain